MNDVTYVPQSHSPAVVIFVPGFRPKIQIRCRSAPFRAVHANLHHRARAEQTRLPAFGALRIRKSLPLPNMPQRSLTSFFGAPKSSSKMETPGSGSGGGSSKRASPDSSSSDAVGGEPVTAAAGAGTGGEAGAKRPKVASKIEGACERAGACGHVHAGQCFCERQRDGAPRVGLHSSLVHMLERPSRFEDNSSAVGLSHFGAALPQPGNVGQPQPQAA